MESRDWIKDGQNKAPALRASAKAAAAEMFASGDLSEFLKIMSRLPGYNACNLLLILQQYPRASCLAGYKVWERLLADPKAPVLKPEWWGKGIDLIVPFTEQRDKHDLRLTWFAVKQFDIGQTNVTYTLPPSIYKHDDDHMKSLIEGAYYALRTEYHRTVYTTGASDVPSSTGLPGIMEDKIVRIRSNAKDTAKLEWLVDCLCTLQGGTDLLPPACHDVFFACIRNALWRTWSLDDPYSLYSYNRKIRNMSDDIQMEFLDLLQRSFRSIEESIAAGYLDVRERLEKSEDLKELDEEVLLEDFRPSPYS